ncbi:TPA: phage virion morphogenesis protein [Escherichia coli]|nr:phage virion morphogenesis protein [Escherichia coli]
MAELQKVDDWLSALLANLEPAARSRMMRQLAQELRRTQQQNIRMQRNPDGSSYEPRRVTARSKKGRIKRQMFAKLRTTKYLKTAASADSASVQFEGKVQRIARVHHYGLRDRVSRKGPETGEAPGTFRLDIGVQDQGITEDTYLELERLISDAKPCSRHMIGMSINLQTSGPHWVGAASYLGEEITIYPYINETIISGGTAHEGGAVHVIDTMRVNP